jgi:AraC family transcriptional regulator
MSQSAISGIDAFAEACHRKPSFVRDDPARRCIALYGWRTGPTQEVHIARTREVILSVHLGGARRVRVYTEEGLSRSFSKPGDITLVPSNHAVSYRTGGEVEFATLHFPVGAAVANDEVTSTLSNLNACLFALRDDYVVSSVKTLMRASRAQIPGDARYFAALFDALSCHIARIVREGDAERVCLAQTSGKIAAGPNFDEVAREIEKRLADKLTLQELADMAGVGRSTFVEHFNRRFGCSPHKYITHKRIELAKSLLRQGRLSVTDIAYEVGFSGQSHFSATFRALTGHVPTAFPSISQADDPG